MLDWALPPIPIQVSASSSAPHWYSLSPVVSPCTSLVAELSSSSHHKLVGASFSFPLIQIDSHCLHVDLLFRHIFLFCRFVGFTVRDCLRFARRESRQLYHSPPLSPFVSQLHLLSLLCALTNRLRGIASELNQSSVLRRSLLFDDSLSKLSFYGELSAHIVLVSSASSSVFSLVSEFPKVCRFAPSLR